MKNLEKILEFLHLIGRLKTTYRFKANEKCLGDSSADHSWRLALMTFMIAEELKLDLDIAKAVKIALVHDLAESITGDIDVRLIKQKVFTKEQKRKSEEEAMIKLKKILPKRLGGEINDLWLEYERESSREALYIKALDKIETSMHIVELGEGAYDDTDLIGTYGNENVAKFPELKDFSRLIKEEIKKEFKKGGFAWKEEYNVE